MFAASGNKNNVAVQRLEQIKSQLNLNPSSMSLQAPQDMAKERAAASFNIEALQHFWMDGKDKYLARVGRRTYIYVDYATPNAVLLITPFPSLLAKGI